MLEAIDQSLDSPKIQSKALNELGNIFYKETNGWLDQQNIMQARKSWKQALKHYGLAAEIDGNINFIKQILFTEQIEKKNQFNDLHNKRQNWRDLNGDGIPQKVNKISKVRSFGIKMMMESIMHPMNPL